MSSVAGNTEDSPRDPGWTSNCTLAEVSEVLRAARFVLVLTHARPDGDAVGSSLAIARALALAGREAIPAYSGQWSHRFDPLVGSTRTIRFGAPEEIAGKIGGREPDAVVIVDTGAWQQVSEAKRWIEPRREKTIVIDHHVHGDPDIAARRHIDVAASAACQPAAELSRILLGKRSCAELPVEIAEPLYVGLATDTGWFRHSNVTPLVFGLGAELLLAGVDHAKCYAMIEQSDTIARPKLMARALTSMTLHFSDRLAVMAISRRDFEECSGTLDDAGGLGDLPMCVREVRASVILTETDVGVVKMSLRSKRLADGEAVDVNEVARKLGGGGHKQASGARVKASLEEARSQVVRAFEDAW